MSTSADPRASSEYVRMFASIFDFMRKAGISDRDIKNICALALEDVSMRADPGIPDSDGIASAAMVLDAWHRNRSYLDKAARPRAIRLLGRSPSVEALIRSEGIHKNPPALARKLVQLGLVARTTSRRYEPVSRTALVGKLDPVIQQYVARSSAALLRTIKNNVTSSKRARRLIERFAEVPDLPTHKLAEFRRFTEIQGRVFLHTLNEWLESHRARRKRASQKDTARVGVHVYAYIESRK